MQLLSWLIKGDVMYSHKVPGYCDSVSHHILESVCVHLTSFKVSFMFEICSPVLPIRTLPYTWQLAVAILTPYTVLVTKELESTSQITSG